MTIQNSLGVPSYSRRLARGFAGQPQGDVKSRPHRNALLPQISTVTIAGFAADADSFTIFITLPNGTRVTAATITRAAGVPADDTAAAAAAVTAINALAALRGHVVATSALGVVTLTFVHPNISYLVETEVTACTATVATSQSPGGSAIPLGRFVARGGASVGGAPALTVLTASSDADDIAGILLRPVAQYANQESALASAVDLCPAGNMADVAFEGQVLMLNTGSAVAAGDPVHVVRVATGGDEVGEARGAADGAAHVATITVVADHQNYEVVAELLVNGERRRLSFSYNPTDGTTTTDDVIDGLEDAAAAAITAQGLTGIVAASAASASATMTLTTTAGYEFLFVNVSSFGEDTEAVGGTVALTGGPAYTIPLPLERAYWAEAVAAGAIGPVQIRM